ncbi:hypothetical protein Taro_037586, partial [Colocasia esculenta]|nr:hypothetical protein [Colocasia esculenta]
MKVYDQQSGNWWVHLQGAPMGYWPKKLVAPSLDFGARYAVVAGEIYNSKPGGQHTSTQMGSGHFAPEGFRNASFFKNIELAGADSQFATPGAHDVQAYTNRPECYNLHPPDRKSTQWGMYFYYGGPGKSAQCT